MQMLVKRFGRFEHLSGYKIFSVASNVDRGLSRTEIWLRIVLKRAFQSYAFLPVLHIVITSHQP